MKCLLSFFVLLLLTGCHSTEPISIETSGNNERLSEIQCGKKAVIAPIIFIYKEDKSVREIPLHRKKQFDQVLSQQQDEMKAKIRASLIQILEQDGFVIQSTNQEIETLLTEVSSHHTSLLSQYRSKNSCRTLLSNVSTLSGADGVILAEVLVKQGVPGHYDFIFSGSVSEDSSSTSVKVAYISTVNAEHLWYGESYMRRSLKESDIEKLLNVLTGKVK